MENVTGETEKKKLIELANWLGVERVTDSLKLQEIKAEIIQQTQDHRGEVYLQKRSDFPKLRINFVTEIL